MAQTMTGCIPGRTCGAMDNASAYGAEDSRFESWQVRCFFSFFCFVFRGFFHTKNEMLGVCRAAAGTFVHGSVAERSKALV